MMARDEVRAQYTVDAKGFIRSPGKFEGEPEYVPAFWDVSNDGFADADCGPNALFTITDRDRAEWPGLAKVAALILHEREDGFVKCGVFASTEAAEVAWELIENDEGGEDE